MIKNLLDLSRYDFKKFISQELKIYEKLDMIYFKIEVNKNGVFPKKRPRYLAVSDIDCICNSIYKDIYEFSQNYILPHKKELIDKFGEFTVGFFYLPVHRSKMIDYYNLDEKTFIISDANKSLDLNEFFNIINNHNVNIMKEPIIFLGKLSNELIYKLLLLYDEKRSVEMIKVLNEYNIKPYSDNKLDDIEGYVFKTKTKIYQLKVNNVEPSIEKEITKPYRDIILQSLSKSIDDELINDLNGNDTYINKVCKLFIYFMNHSDVFTRYKFEPEDLMPPISGYFGDIDLSAIDNEDVKTMCAVSKLCKNILRIFLHTFTNPISLNKFKDMPEKDKENLNKLIQVLNYRNYAEITKNL